MFPVSGVFSCFLALLICLVMVLYRRRVRREEAVQMIAMTIPVCLRLADLVRQLQQHRGMSSAWLAGDAGFAEGLGKKQQQIADLLPAVLLTARKEAVRRYPCLSSNEVSLLAFHWRCLVDELPELTPEESIARHTQLIARVLDWLNVYGERRLEPLLSGMTEIGMARNFTGRLPQLSECLGQARAIGTAVAARHACSPGARVRLMFLIGRAETLFGQAESIEPGNPSARLAGLLIGEMATTVRTRMLLTTGIVVDPGEFFDLATRTIDSVFTWMGANAEALAPRIASATPARRPAPLETLGTRG